MARTVFKMRSYLLTILFVLATEMLVAQEAIHSAIEPPPPAEPPPQEATSYRSPSELKKLPIEQLVDIKILSASRRLENLSEASSAVDVITADDIRRAGVTNIPDALRLGPEVQVAQVDGHTWGISTRGFKTTTSNKMLVLMDGRSLYTPLFSGVFWDVQQTFMPDIEQIEIVRGPGATLWGANAVNGVINIRTKTADETQGLLVFGGGGNEETGFGGLRYGGMLNRDTAYRVYAMHQSRDALHLEGDGSAEDDTQITQGGFRIDSKLHSEDILTLQGDVYNGTFGQLNAGDVDADGENLIGRWTRNLGNDSTLSLQAYFDRTHRVIPTVFEEQRETYDIELQHQFRYRNHDIVYGANYRASHDDIGNLGPTLAFIPDEETVHLVSAYVQDEWHIVPNVFSITAGSKFEYNSFSGFEVQPAGRFSWHPAENQTVWGAVSRAVRTPTQIDQDLTAPNPNAGQPPLLVANHDFDSEELIAYELGYRIKPVSRVSFDIAGYYNDYDSIRSVEPTGAGAFPITLANKLEAQSYGGSLSARWRVTDWWALDGSVSAFESDFERKADSRDTSNGSAEGNDPNWSFITHSALDLPGNVQVDSYLRYVGDLPQPATAAYFELDLRVGWSPIRNVEIAVVGRNLLDNAHPEFRGQTLTREVERSIYGTFRWSF
jgi:iron complex outermembrane receptor protein